MRHITCASGTRAASLSALVGKPGKLQNRLRALFLGQFLDLGGDLVGRAFLAARTWPPATAVCRTPPQPILLIFGSTFPANSSLMFIRPALGQTFNPHRSCAMLPISKSLPELRITPGEMTVVLLKRLARRPRSA